jgi:hypothetical protein
MHHAYEAPVALLSVANRCLRYHIAALFWVNFQPFANATQSQNRRQLWNLVPFCLSGICAWHFPTTYLYPFRLRAYNLSASILSTGAYGAIRFYVASPFARHMQMLLWITDAQLLRTFLIALRRLALCLPSFPSSLVLPLSDVLLAQLR